MTKAKALIDKETKEWGIITEGMIGTSQVPQLLASTTTKDRLQKLYPYMELDEFEMADVEVSLEKEKFELNNSE